MAPPPRPGGSLLIEEALSPSHFAARAPTPRAQAKTASWPPTPVAPEAERPASSRAGRVRLAPETEDEEEERRPKTPGAFGTQRWPKSGEASVVPGGRKKSGLGQRLIFCKGTLGNTDGCLLCRMRADAGAPQPPASPKTMDRPAFRAGRARPRLLERGNGEVPEDAPPTGGPPGTPHSLAASTPAARSLAGSASPNRMTVTVRAPGASSPSHLSPTAPGGGMVEAPGSVKQASERTARTFLNLVGQEPPGSSAASAAGGSKLWRRAADEVKPKSVLWGAKPPGTFDERMVRLDQSRRIKAQMRLASENRDKVGRAEVESAQESFSRHLPPKGRFDRAPTMEALADFGLRVRKFSEKLALDEAIEYVLKQSHCQRPGHGFDFGTFCDLIEAARSAFRHSMSGEVFKAWKGLETEDLFVGRKELYQFLEVLGLGPAADGEEKVRVERVITEDLAWDRECGPDFGEAQFLALQVRTIREGARRREERNIQEQYDLSDELFLEFRPQLVELHDAFEQADEDSSGALDMQEATSILYDFGCLSSGSDWERGQQVISELIGKRGDIEYDDFLLVIKKLRAMSREQRKEHLFETFDRYNKDDDEELDTQELFNFLVCLDLLPRTTQQQTAMVRLLEEADADGSGKFDLDELQYIVQAISERFLQVQRTRERAKAEELGFERHQINELLRCFAFLDMDASGMLNAMEVRRAARMMDWNLKLEKMQRIISDADTDSNGQIDFVEFLIIMKKIEEMTRQQMMALEQAAAGSPSQEAPSSQVHAGRQPAAQGGHQGGQPKAKPHADRRAKDGHQGGHSGAGGHS